MGEGEGKIFGQFETMEEADAAFKKQGEDIAAQNTKIEEANKRIEELEKPKVAPKTSENDLVWTPEDEAKFAPEILSAMQKREKILVNNIQAHFNNQKEFDKAVEKQEEWITTNFSKSDNPEMDITNEKGKLFILSQEIWDKSYKRNLLYQKASVLEAFHQLSETATPSPDTTKKAVGSYEAGTNYSIEVKGKEMPWEEFVKLPEWRRNEILAEEAQAKSNALLNR